MKLGRFRLIDKFEVPNFDEPGENYLTRWRLIETPWFGVFVHRFDGPDSRPTLHDHPWSFVSILLRGGYVEQRRVETTRAVIRRHVRFVNVMRRDDAHFIETLDRTPSWSLLLVGKRRRTWGYWRPVGNSGRGAEYWTPFDRDPHGDEFDRAMALRGGDDNRRIA